MRCSFNLVSDFESILDDEGVEVRDVEHARREAMEAIEELRVRDGSFADDWLGWRLEAVDEKGSILFVIGFGAQDEQEFGFAPRVAKAG